MKNSAILSFSRGDDGPKSKPQHGGLSIAFQGHKQGDLKKQSFLHVLAPSTEPTPALSNIRQLYPVNASNSKRLRSHQGTTLGEASGGKNT